MSFNARDRLKVCVGGGPEYIVDRKLGKGGFGQVFIGRRVQTSKQKDGANANYVSSMTVLICLGLPTPRVVNKFPGLAGGIEIRA